MDQRRSWVRVQKSDMFNTRAGQDSSQEVWWYKKSHPQPRDSHDGVNSGKAGKTLISFFYSVVGLHVFHRIGREKLLLVPSVAAFDVQVHNMYIPI